MNRVSLDQAPLDTTLVKKEQQCEKVPYTIVIGAEQNWIAGTQGSQKRRFPRQFSASLWATP
eukprot:4325547-Pyramimonas_sp.AAC.1